MGFACISLFLLLWGGLTSYDQTFTLASLSAGCFVQQRNAFHVSTSIFWSESQFYWVNNNVLDDKQYIEVKCSSSYMFLETMPWMSFVAFLYINCVVSGQASYLVRFISMWLVGDTFILYIFTICFYFSPLCLVAAAWIFFLLFFLTWSFFLMIYSYWEGPSTWEV